jgi:hypothetical protein
MPTIDMTRIKANVAKMASMNAPMEDIDGYIASEGTTVEAVKAFNQPQYRGGAKSPALQAAQKDVRVAQMQNQPFSILARGLAQTADPMRTLALPTTIPASIASNIQQKTPQNIIPDLGKVVTGQSSPDYKQILRQANVPPVAANVGGEAMDIALYPGGARAAVDLAKATPSLVRGGIKNVGKGINYVKDAFTGEARARIAAGEQKFALKQSTSQQAKKISDTAKSQANNIQAKQEDVNKGFDELSSKLKGEIAKEADQQGLNLQRDLPKLYAQKSEEYASKQKNILGVMSESEKNIPVGKVTSDLENVLLKFRVLKRDPVKGLVETDVPLTPAESKVLGIYKDLKKGTEPVVSQSPILGEGGKPIIQTVEPKGTISVEDLISHKQYIRPSTPKYGQQWGSDEKLQSEASDVFSKYTPEPLKKLDREYAPFLELKSAVNDRLKPFSGKYDVATGTLSKVGGTADASEQRLMTDLNATIGRQVEGRIRGLNKRLDVIPGHKEMIQNASNEAIKQIRSDAANEVWKLKRMRDVKAHNIDQAVNRLAHKYKTRQLKLGILGVATIGGGLANTIKYFLHREIYSGMKNP